MVDAGGDSQRATPVATEMSFMILEEEAAHRFRKVKLVSTEMASMNLCTDASIVSQASDIGIHGPKKLCRSELAASRMAPLRTHSVLAKRRRSESAQVLVALRRQEDKHQQHQQHFHRQIISTSAMTISAPLQPQPQVIQRQIETAYEVIDDDDQQICTTPTHSSIQQEGPCVCPPPPPNKPKSKPRKHMTLPHKNFFVPSNLHQLPLCFQSLFP